MAVKDDALRILRDEGMEPEMAGKILDAIFENCPSATSREAVEIAWKAYRDVLSEGTKPPLLLQEKEMKKTKSQPKLDLRCEYCGREDFPTRIHWAQHRRHCRTRTLAEDAAERNELPKKPAAAKEFLRQPDLLKLKALLDRCGIVGTIHESLGLLVLADGDILRVNDDVTFTEYKAL